MMLKKLLPMLLVVALLFVLGCDNPAGSDPDSTKDEDATSDDGSGDDGTTDNGTSDLWFNDTPLTDDSSSDDTTEVYEPSLSDLEGEYSYDTEVGDEGTLTISSSGDVSRYRDHVGYEPRTQDYDSVSIDGFTMTGTWTNDTTDRSGTDTYYILGDSDGEKFLIVDPAYGLLAPEGVTLSDIFDDVSLGAVRKMSSSFEFELDTGAGARGVQEFVDSGVDRWKIIFNEDSKPEYFDTDLTEASYAQGEGAAVSNWPFGQESITLTVSPSLYTADTPVEAETYAVVITFADVAADAEFGDRLVVTGRPGDVSPGLSLSAFSNLLENPDADNDTVEVTASFGFADGQSIDDYESVKIERQVPGFVWHEIESNVKDRIAEEIGTSGDWIYEDTSAEIPRAYYYRMTLKSPSGNEFVASTDDDDDDPLIHAPKLSEVEKSGNTNVDDNLGTFSVEAVEHAKLQVSVAKPDGSVASSSEGRSLTHLEYPENSVTVGPVGSGADYEVSDDNTNPTDYQVSFKRYFEFPNDPNETQHFVFTPARKTYTLYK